MRTPIVCSVVFGDKAPDWEYWMLKSLKKVHPNAVYHRSAPDMDSMRYLFGEKTQRSASGYCKARAWADFVSDTGPLWILDVDLLVLRPLAWRPTSAKTVIAAVEGGDEKYLDFAKLAGLETESKVHLNMGVIWVRGDIFPYWEKWYPRVRKAMGDSPYPLSECTLNAIWHDLNNKGMAELLPISYNQIITEHGPFGATIFHLAGTPEHFRLRLMESYYCQLCSPEE